MPVVPVFVPVVPVPVLPVPVPVLPVPVPVLPVVPVDEVVAPVPVVDETGLTEPFAARLEWDPGKGVDGLREALAKIGLSLEEQNRESPRYRVAPKV